jgi:D-arabinose 1-dehydrogenase-like Zn-dependent alcohol dehydrogenase
MRAVRLDEFGGPEVLRTVEAAVPAPAIGEVLVEVAACGVCGLDAMRRAGQLDDRRGMVLGHEIAGTVVAVGEGVERLRAGDRVAAVQRRSCGRCEHCRAGRSVLCASGRLYGDDLDGGYAQYAAMAESSLALVPAGVELRTAAVAACAIGTSLHALRLADFRAGDRVLVTGAGGGLGVHALELVRALGGVAVAVTSSSDNVQHLSAITDDVVVAEERRFDEQIRERNLRPAVVLDMTASFTLDESLRTVAAGGAVVVVGTLGTRPVELSPGALIMREVRLLGSKATTLEELGIVLDLLDRGRIETHISAALDLEDVARAHAMLGDRAVRGRVVLEP